MEDKTSEGLALAKAMEVDDEEDIFVCVYVYIL